MRALLALPLFAITVSGCAAIGGGLATVGVSMSTMEACTALLAAEIGGLSQDTTREELDAAKDRLLAGGKACLVTALKDVAGKQLTVAPIAATATAEPAELVAGDATAAAALAE